MEYQPTLHHANEPSEVTWYLYRFDLPLPTGINNLVCGEHSRLWGLASEVPVVKSEGI